MSDLVKFVAAVLKEKVAADLEEENKQLRLKNERLENERAKALEHASRNGRVEITGKGGSPVYAHGDMTDAEPTIIRGEVCRFDFSGPNTCPISKLLESEIRLNGILVGLSAG